MDLQVVIRDNQLSQELKDKMWEVYQPYYSYTKEYFMDRVAKNNYYSFYKNGSQVGTFTAPNGPTNQAIKIGHPSFQASVDFNMDEFRVSGIVRSADWIRAQYLSIE